MNQDMAKAIFIEANHFEISDVNEMLAISLLYID
jgi:hypothetical protein